MITVPLKFSSNGKINEEQIANRVCSYLQYRQPYMDGEVYSVQFEIDGLPVVWQFMCIEEEWTRVMPICESPCVIFKDDRLD